MSVEINTIEEFAFGSPKRGDTVVMAFSGTHLTTAFAAETMYRLVATENCHVCFSTGTTATTSDMYMPAGVVEYFTTTDLDTYISVIRNTTNGNLYVTKLTSARDYLKLGD